MAWLVIGCIETFRYVLQVRQNFSKARKFAKRLSEVNQLLLDEKDKLENQAKHDELTNCLNRHGLNDLLGKLQNELMGKGQYAAVILLDIDFFKKINDNFGHDKGDKVLVEVAKILASNIRRSDYIVRWGGEEFVVLCLDTRLTDAIALADKLRQAIQAESIIAGQPPITCSFGVAALKHGNFVQCFAEADSALYQAKQQGRNRVISAG